MATAEEIINQVRALSANERAKVLAALETEAREHKRAERARLASEIRGKYKGLLSTVDEFIARKQEEIELEDYPMKPLA